MKDFNEACSEQQDFRRSPGHTMHFPLPVPKKLPTASSATPLATSCLPVSVRTLCTNTTHHGQVLRGVVAVSDLMVMQGVALLLEDDNKDLVRVSGVWGTR